MNFLAEAKVDIFALKSHNKVQLMLIKTKKNLVKMQNCGILAKSQHLTKITVSLITVFPRFSTVPGF